MVLAQKTLDTVKGRFDPKAAAGQNLVFQFQFTDDQPYFLEVAEGQCLLTEGLHPDSSVCLTMDSQTFDQLISGHLDGFTAFSSGQLQVEGNITLAPKLRELFPA